MMQSWTELFVDCLKKENPQYFGKASSHCFRKKYLVRLQIHSNPEVEMVFNSYPDEVREKIWNLRRIIIEVANEIEGIDHLEETLKWGEPSYLVKKGSTLRIGWRKNQPNQYGMYFQCTTHLVPTFRMFYEDLFSFEGNRAIIFQINDQIPEMELKKCIAAALTYHKVNRLPRLGW